MAGHFGPQLKLNPLDGTAADSVDQVTRTNHFLPRWYLRHWSDDTKRVRLFRTLVSSDRVPVWTDYAIASAGSRPDLYTSIETGVEVDRFERWLSEEVDEPAARVVQRIVNGGELRREDSIVLAKLFASLDVRTPSAFSEFMARWEKELPELIEDSLRESVAKLEGDLEAAIKEPQEDAVDQQFPLPASIEIGELPGDEAGGYVRAEITAGRSLWLHSMERALTGPAMAELTRHSWTILEPYGNYEWVTSDHPALRLNFHSEDRYDFGGGWGSNGTELLLPVSPRHMLYTKVGVKEPERRSLSAEGTFLIQQFLAERAHRSIFSRLDQTSVSWHRNRAVDAEAFAGEAEMWKRFHEQQVSAEESDSDEGPANKR